MKINEILTEDIEQLDELNWKKAAAAATLAGAGLFGGGQAADAQTMQTNKPVAQQSQDANQRISQLQNEINHYYNNIKDDHQVLMMLGILYQAQSRLSPHQQDLYKKITNFIHPNDFNPQIRSFFNDGRNRAEKMIRSKNPRVITDLLLQVQNGLDNVDSSLSRVNAMKNAINNLKHAPQTQPKSTSSVGSQDAEILSNFKGWFERIRNTYGEVDQKLVDKLSADGLDNLVKSYSNFRSDYSKIQSPEVKKQYEKLLLDLKKDIDLYHSFIENMYKQMPSLPTK